MGNKIEWFSSNAVTEMCIELSPTFEPIGFGSYVYYLRIRRAMNKSFNRSDEMKTSRRNV